MAGTNPVVSESMPEFDLGPLSWVQGEIDQALNRGLEALASYAVSPADVTALQHARTHVHQAAGAIAMVGLDAVVTFTDEIERQLATLDERSTAEFAAACAGIDRACRKLQIFLDELVNGAPAVPLKLFPEYEAMQHARGVRAAAPTDLFYPELGGRPPAPAPGKTLSGDMLPAYLVGQRRRYQRGLLAWLRGNDEGARQMRDALKGIEQSSPQPSLRTFWWTAGALLEAITEGGLDASFGVKQLTARIDLQIRRVVEGSAKVADRLRREVLYYVAISAPVASSVEAVQRGFSLSGLIPTAEVLNADLVRMQPHLRQAREQLAMAKESWLKFTSGRAENLPKLKQMLQSVHAHASSIGNPALITLTSALVARLESMPSGNVSEPVAMEYATAMLLAESAFSNHTNVSPELARQVETMLARLDAAQAARPFESGAAAPMLDEMSKRAQERVLLAQVGREIQANLRHMEQVLDGFFRDHSKRSELSSLARDGAQIRGALRMLGLNQADELLELCQVQIASYADSATEISDEALELLAESLSGLGFYVEAVERQHVDHGRLIAPLLARQRGEAPATVADADADSVEAAVLELRNALPELVAEVHRAPADLSARKTLKSKLEVLRDDAELIGDTELVAQAKAGLRELEQGGTAAIAITAIAESGNATPAPTVSAETQRLLDSVDHALDAELLEIFLAEAAEVLDTVAEHHRILGHNPGDREALRTVRRQFHTLKGSGRMVGLLALGEIAYDIEKIHNRLLEEDRPVTPSVLALINLGEIEFRRWVTELGTQGRVEPDGLKIHDAIRAVESELPGRRESVVKVRSAQMASPVPAPEIEMPPANKPVAAKVTAPTKGATAATETATAKETAVAAETAAAMEIAAATEVAPTLESVAATAATHAATTSGKRWSQLPASTLVSAAPTNAPPNHVVVDQRHTEDALDNISAHLADVHSTGEVVAADLPELGEALSGYAPLTLDVIGLPELAGGEAEVMPSLEPAATLDMIDQELQAWIAADGALDTPPLFAPTTIEGIASDSQVFEPEPSDTIASDSLVFEPATSDGIAGDERRGSEILGREEITLNAVVPHPLLLTVVPLSSIKGMQDDTASERNVRDDSVAPGSKLIAPTITERSHEHSAATAFDDDELATGNSTAATSAIEESPDEPSTAAMLAEIERLILDSESTEAGTEEARSEDVRNEQALNEEGRNEQGRNEQVRSDRGRNEEVLNDELLTDEIAVGSVTLSRALFNILTAEADEHLDTLAYELTMLQFDPGHELSASMVRASHTLCGIHRTGGFPLVAITAGALEQCLLGLQQRTGAMESAAQPVLARAIVGLTALVAKIKAQERFSAADALEAEEIQRELDLLRHESSQRADTTAAHNQAEPGDVTPAAIADSEDSGATAKASAPASLFPAGDQTIKISPSVAASGAASVAAPGTSTPAFAPSSIASPSAITTPPAMSSVSAFASASTAVPISSTSTPAAAPIAVSPPVPKAPIEIETPLDQIHDEIDEQLLPIFLEEADELFPLAADQLRAWRRNIADSNHPSGLRRTLHTFKGSARMAGAMRLGELTHRMETRLVVGEDLNQGTLELFDALDVDLDRVAFVLDALRQGHTNVALPGLSAVAVAPVPASVADAAAHKNEHVDVPRQASAANTAEAPPAESAVVVRLPVFQPVPAVDARKMPREHVEPLQTAAEADAGQRAMLRVRADLIDRLVNEAGEVAIARARVEGELRTLKANLLELTNNVIRMRAQVREIEIQAESQIQSRLSLRSEVNTEFDPLEFDRYTRFQELTRSLAEGVNDVSTVQQALLRNVDDADAALVAQARLSREVQQQLFSIRTVPFGSLSDRLYRILRQVAKELDKRANLDIRGTQVELDRSVLEKLVGPLEHLLRNALDHGLESREARLAAGKPATGEIVMTVRQVGNEIAIELKDDGAGLDLARIRARAVAHGRLAADSEPTDAQIVECIFAPGFSTASKVTAVSGRGIGMDVVRSEVTTLGGRVEVSTNPGHGTTFLLYLPLTLAVAQAVLVRAGGRLWALPAPMVEQVQQIKAEALKGLYGAGRVLWQERTYPFFYLPRLLGDSQNSPIPGRFNPVLLLRTGQGSAAVHVDEMIGNQEVVVKNIGPQLARVSGIAGATVLGTGEIVLIINPVQLAQRADVPTFNPDAEERIVQSSRAAVDVAARLPLVMVVDDSLTVRKITSRLLTREGFEVATAKDGIDALQRIEETARLPDVILLDIEMPRMDGFEFTRTIKADSRHAHIPIIVITSRTAEKHRNLAKELGADLYLGKPYQEQELLGHLRDMLSVTA